MHLIRAHSAMYHAPPIDDLEILDRLPVELRQLLKQANGYVAYHGGLHLRGACRTPDWHSLRAAWEGTDALHRLYAAVEPGDLPFAEDAFGDQFVLRGGIVHRLAAETGEIGSLDLGLVAFDEAVRADPVDILSLQPLQAFRARGGHLLPGELLNVYPPFVAQEPGADVSYRAIPALEQRRWLADLARQLQDLPDGTRIELTPAP